MMADAEKPKADRRPESPTTARELDFDDEDVPASPKAIKTTGTESTIAPHSAREEVPPPQPPRPISVQQENENTLKEAFPNIEFPVIKAVLVASGGQLDPAFMALLSMSDPSAQIDEPTPPAQPPRPTQTTGTGGGQRQVEADALYARQLAEHYNGGAVLSERNPRSRAREPRGPNSPRQRQEMANEPDEDRERSFIDDDLPVIRDNIRKGFLETQSKVNSFITNLKKKIDGEDEEEQIHPIRPTGRTQTGFSSGQQGYGSRQSEDVGRRSGDRDRYDADPQVLGDDFAALQMRDETTPRRPNRPLANPDLFKSTPATPHSQGRRVSFQEGPPEEIDDLYRASPEPKQQSSASKGNKWQPMAAVDPSPIADHDPFSLGDSDDDAPKKDVPVKPEDAERLKLATAEAMADDLGPTDKKESSSVEKAEETTATDKVEGASTKS